MQKHESRVIVGDKHLTVLLMINKIANFPVEDKEI